MFQKVNNCFGWVSKLVQLGRSRNTRWRPTPLNPFWKRGEINFIWPNFKLERSDWQQCPIHSWFDSAEIEWVIWPWKITPSQIALDCTVCVQMYTSWTQYKATLLLEWHPLFFLFLFYKFANIFTNLGPDQTKVRCLICHFWFHAISAWVLQGVS